VLPARDDFSFLVDVPAGVDIEQFTNVLVCCEAFNEFITSAQYR
jgi:hypothetical protein